MKHTIPLAILVLLVLYAFPAAMGRSVAFTDIAPPVPASLIEKIDEHGHPFLLAQRSRFREARSLLNNTFFEERGDRFTYRVNGYLDPETPWYLGEGPLQDNPDFHPSMLPETDFRFYAQVLCEAMAFYGIDHAQWSRHALILEMERLLDEIEFGYIVNEQALSQPAITQKHMAMFSLTALLYDMIYHRIDTKDRHALNDRFKRERDRLALYCKSKSINNLPPNQRALLGSALGLSTLMCISIYPHEWANTGLFSIQSFLPDIYRAVNLTRDGFDELVARDGQIRCRFHDLELFTLLATPWIECMNSLGYPYAIKPGGYTKLVAALEQHRLKGTLQLLEPVDSRYIQDPWIPKTATIYEPDNPINYPEDEKDGKVVRVKRRDTTFEQEEEDETSKTAKKPDPMMGIRNPESITINQIQTGTRLTLREQIEKLSLPRPTPTPTPLVPVEDRPNWQAGWSRPKKLTLPGALGVLYLQAAKENPNGAAAVAWEARFWEEYQHPYAFLYYKS
ncbi:hypothetical protein GF373_11555, partial [bacterium]|nr:hypothetical protein [bacterium]